MEINELNREFVRELIKNENNLIEGMEITFAYKNSNSNIWNLTLKREEDKYFPFIFSLYGKKQETNETWSRKYIELRKVILHIINDFNENADVKNKYNDIEEYLNEENLRKFDYMMLDRLRMDCSYFLGNGNGYINHLYYKDIDKHIEEMKKIYNSFSEEEKPEWINLEDIEDFKTRMKEMIEKNEEAEENCV